MLSIQYWHVIYFIAPIQYSCSAYSTCMSYIFCSLCTNIIFMTSLNTGIWFNLLSFIMPITRLYPSWIYSAHKSLAYASTSFPPMTVTMTQLLLVLLRDVYSHRSLHIVPVCLVHIGISWYTYAHCNVMTFNSPIHHPLCWLDEHTFIEMMWN